MSRRAGGAANEYSRRVIEAVRVLRDRAGLSNADVIRTAGFSVNYFYVRLRGEAPFDTNDIDRIARALGVEVQDIVSVAASVRDPAADDELVLLDGVEMARRARYLLAGLPARPDVDGVAPGVWELLLSGAPEVAVPRASLGSIAEYFAVDLRYLVDLDSREIAEHVEAELELSRALEDAGAAPLAARALGGLPPSALLAVAESIRSIEPNDGKS